MAGVLNKIIEGDNVIKEKLVSIDSKLGSLVTYQTNQDKLAKEEQKLKKQQLQALKRQKADKTTTFEKVFGVKDKKDTKGNSGILGMLTGPLMGAIGAIGIPALLSALGIAAIGGAIVAYIASEDFRNFVNNNVIKPIGDFITGTLPKLIDGLKDDILNRHGKTIRQTTGLNIHSNTAETSEKISLTREQAVKARNQHKRKVDKDTIRHASGEITDEELAETKETQTALEKIVEVQNQLLKLQTSIELDEKRIEELKQKDLTKPYNKEDLKYLEDRFQATQEQYEKQEKFLMDYIEKNEDAKRVLNRWGEEPIQRQKGGFIVPGHTTGDSFPAMLPEGSLVLNRNAVPHFQKGGLVPTLLEPREQVLYPGNYGMREVMLNKAFPRFQTGGIVALGKDMLAEGYKAWQHPDFNLDSGYTGSGTERNWVRPYDSRHNHNAALDFPGSHNTIAQLDALYAKLNTDEAKQKYGITQLLWRGVEGHGPDLAPNKYHLHVAVGGAQDFRGHGGNTNDTDTAGETAVEKTGSGGGGNIIDRITSGFGLAGQAIGAVYDAFMDVFGDELGALFDFGGGGLLGGGDNGEPGPAGGGGGADASGGAASINDPNARALLNAIAQAEGTAGKPNQGYNTNFGGSQQEQGLRGHPSVPIAYGTSSSDAFGRYQFMSKTWRGLGGKVLTGPHASDGFDMSPENQDKAALRLVAGRKVNISDGLSLNEVYRLGGEWASIEGGPNMVKGGSYNGGNGKQAKYSAEEFLQMYSKYGGQIEGKQSGGLVGGVSNMSGSYSSNLSAKSEEQFIERLATSVTPVINLIPAHQPIRTGGGEASNQTTVPTLSAYPSNNVALDLRNRVSINTAFS